MTVSDIDVRIGERIRALRKRAGLSQKELASRLDIVFQQLQKHENGMSRVPASRLYEIARVLNAPIATFFDVQEMRASKSDLGPLPPALAGVKGKTAQQVLTLVTAFMKIKDERTRANLLTLVSNFARTTPRAKR